MHHFRFIAPLLPKDEAGFSALHYYDSGIQLARYSSREPTEKEFLRCLAAAEEIKKLSVISLYPECSCLHRNCVQARRSRNGDAHRCWAGQPSAHAVAAQIRQLHAPFICLICHNHCYSWVDIEILLPSLKSLNRENLR